MNRIKTKAYLEVTLEQAREWYESGNEDLKKLALTAFSEEMLIPSFKEIVESEEDYGFWNTLVCPPSMTEQLSSLAKLQTVLDALNEGHKFNLLTGTIWYPWVRFFRMKSVPKDAEVIGHFRYQGEKFALVGGPAYNGGHAGLGSFLSSIGVGNAGSYVGMLACKSEEIAKYVSTQFGKLVFDACFARHFEGREFEWLD